MLTPGGTPCHYHRAVRPALVRRWSEVELRRLESLFEDGLSDREAAACLGVPVGAIEDARRAHRVLRRDQILMTTGKVAAWLGCTPRAILDWAEQGWLPGTRRTGKGRFPQWFFTHGEVQAFLADPAHWHRWRPESIPDAPTRRWAHQVRGDVRFLTVAEVADRLCVGAATVHRWVQDGRLPGYRGRRLLIREDDVAAFTLPEIGQGMRKRSWLPCAFCGAADGPIRARSRTPGRRDATAFGVTGRVCETCYVRLKRTAERQLQRAA